MPSGRSLYHRRPARYAKEKDEFQRLIVELKRLVSKRGYSLAQIASEVGVTQITVNNWWTGHSLMGVANVLEGTVRRDGNHVRVSTELVDARNDNTIWADSYDRDLTDIFAIQSEIAETVATKLTAT